MLLTAILLALSIQDEPDLLDVFPESTFRVDAKDRGKTRLSSTSVRQGRMGDREINSRGAELVVLAREDGTWKIRAIHWSSRQLR